MIKTLKLSASLGGLVTASIGVTALSLPQFNSTDSYIFRKNNYNWSQQFISQEAALEYLEGVVENGLLSEEIAGTRTVSEYLVSATMEGLDSSFLFFEDKEDTFDGQVEDTKAAYDAIRDEFVRLLTENFINQIIPMASDVYIPLEDYVSGGATTSTGGTHSLTEYFRGAGDTAFETLDSAFNSLLDQSQIAFGYNGSNYDTIAEVVLAWMTNEGFEGTAAYKAVDNHIRWEASGSYIDTAGVDHAFNDFSESITDQTAFETFIKEAFYNRMVTFENNLTTEHKYNENEWELTSDYTSSRDIWIADNDVKVDPFINSDFLTKTMGDVWGYYSGSTSIGIDGIGEEFFPSRISNTHAFYQRFNNADYSALLPSLNNKLEDSYDIAAFSFLAWHTNEFNNKQATSANWLLNNTKEVCNVDGTSNKDSDLWKSWTEFAVHMGFDKIVIPRGSNLLASPNTINEWWEPDCEGVFLDQNYATSGSNRWDYARFFGDWFLSYFDHGMREIGEWSEHTYNNWVYSHISINPIKSVSNSFKFDGSLYGGALTGKTMIEALLEGGSAPATEADYKATAASYTRDYLDWVSKQDFIYYWNNAEYRGQSEQEAYNLVIAAIRSEIEAQWVNINYNHIQETDYDIDDAYLAVIRAIDPNIQTEDFYSIEEARTAVRASVEANGSNNIWTEVGLVKFIHEDYYNLDTTIEFTSIDEARLHANWNSLASRVTSAFGQTGTFSMLKEYHLDTVMKLINFNNTTTDIMFDMDADELALRLINGYDLSHLDSSLTNISANISDYDLENPESSYDVVSYRFSLAIDDIDSNETVWFTSAEFVYNSEDHLPALLAAKDELITYWTEQIEDQK